MSEVYKKFLKRVHEIYNLRSAQALLGWDQETLMPPRGIKGRAEAMTTLAAITQEKFLSQELGELIVECESRPLNPDEASIVREIKRDREKYQKIPVSLNKEFTKAITLGQAQWAEARKKNDPHLFNSQLSKIFDLLRQKAECLGYTASPYDALLNLYEPGMSTVSVEKMLEGLRVGSTQLLQKIKSAKPIPNMHILSQSFPLLEQEMFSRQVLSDMTFNMEAGRLDVSVHPFSDGITPGDVRLTTRYSETELLMGLYGTIHEGGHGLYEQGFLPKYYRTPLAEAVSLGVHESQSRLWENQVGRSLPFWKHYLPILKKLFPTQLNTETPQDFYRKVNSVSPSLIRVEADEVTYNLHILLRFNVERKLLEKKMEVEDVQEFWENQMVELLGIRPKTAAEGYLQDVHWSAGLVGYFPTYSLGNIFSAQLFHKMSEELGNVSQLMEKAHFQPIREWLRNKIHQEGRRYSPEVLIEKVTGEKPNQKYFMDYLNSKYLEVYGI